MCVLGVTYKCSSVVCVCSAQLQRSQSPTSCCRATEAPPTDTGKVRRVGYMGRGDGWGVHVAVYVDIRI